MKFTAIAVGMVLSIVSSASGVMVPMEQIGPQSRPVFGHANVVRVSGGGGDFKSVREALDSIKDASAEKRYVVLVAAGTYDQTPLRMKPHVDLYGGFSEGGDWKTRDVYANRSVLDARQKGPVVIGADNARLDGFVVTGGQVKAHGAGILCDGVSPTLVNNIIVANKTLKPEIAEGLGKQVANEGAAVALLKGSRAYVANNLICDNSTEIGNGAGITARGNVHAKILRNVFCNNIAGVKDDQMFHGKVGSRSSPGGAIACSAESSPQISFNAIVLCSAPINNDAGGIWVEGNSMPPINYNRIVGNTSGDDGGGIYVMGNLYYDEAGERHDFSPDGPVSVEDNLIAGNSTIRGGPAGLRVSRWGRVDLRRNRIVANESGVHGGENGVILVSEGNIIADNESGSPSFRARGNITGRKFDPDRFVTEIATERPLTDDDIDLEGAPVRIGQQWSLIKSIGPDGIVVWGNVTDTAQTFEVLDDYLPPDHGLNKTERRPRQR